MVKVKRQPKGKRTANKKGVLVMFFMVLGLFVTVGALLNPQYLRQFADYNSPPLFGCLHTGEADPTLCGTRMGESGVVSYSLYGRPFDPKLQTVYYNDTLSGAYSYSNTGDQVINIKHMGVAAGSLSTYYIADFDPLQGPSALKPKQNLTIKTSTHMFRSPEPNGPWIVGAGLTDTNGQALPVPKEESTNIHVSATCTALRVEQLTATDKSNIKSLCSKNPNDKLCTSKQYCQIFKGGSCNQPELSPDIDGQQCDDAIVLAKSEQDILEDLCKAYPDTSACERFCMRSIGSSLCPKILLWFNKAGKQVIPEKARYMADSGTGNGSQSVAGAEIAMSALGVGGGTPSGQLFMAPPPSAPPSSAGAAPAKIAPLIAAGATVQPSMNPGVNPATGKALPGSPGYTPAPSCASHRQNEQGTCCASGYPLIQDTSSPGAIGCCQPGCFVWSSQPLNNTNCPAKDKSGKCCALDAIQTYGVCHIQQANGQLSSVPVTDPKIFPPGFAYNSTGGTYVSGSGPTTTGSTGGGSVPALTSGVGINTNANRIECQIKDPPMQYNAATNMCDPLGGSSTSGASSYAPGDPACVSAGCAKNEACTGLNDGSAECYTPQPGPGASTLPTCPVSAGKGSSVCLKSSSCVCPGASSASAPSCIPDGSSATGNAVCCSGNQNNGVCGPAAAPAVAAPADPCIKRDPSLGMCTACASGYTLNQNNNQCQTTQ